MSETVYDANARLYIDFVDRALAAEPSLFKVLLETIVRLLADRLPGARICDVACGEGYVSRALVAAGAREVAGVDLSSVLIDEARRRADAPTLSYAVDDAHTLSTIADSSCDVCVSQMAMMDIADHRAAFTSVRRVLRPGGAFVFSMLHPCFEGPYSPPDEPHFQQDADGAHTAVIVRRYASEGHWRSEGAGGCGHVGSYHRMLSTYLNALIGAGFRLERFEEPVAGTGLPAEVPRVVVISATLEGR